MKDQENQQSGPVRRLPLYLGAVVLVPLFMALMLAFTVGSVLVILRSHTRLVQVTSNDGATQWPRLGDLAGMPEQLVVAADGSLWVRTRLWGSLAHYKDGRWETFRHETFHTRSNAPRHDFVVVGDRPWAAIDNQLVHFDGQRWQSQLISQAAADHVLAADQQTVWVLGNDGILRTLRGGKWEATNLRATIAEAAWELQKPLSAPHLIATADDSLWLCSETVWRNHGGAWTPVKLAGKPLSGVELLGYAGGKVWFRDGDRLLWVADNAADSGCFTARQLGLKSSGHIDGVHQIAGDVCASGSDGIHVLDGGRWKLKWPAPEGVCRCQAVAGTNGHIYAIALYLTPIPLLWLAVPMAAVLSGAALWGIRRLINRRYSLLMALSSRLLVMLALVAVLTVVGMVSETSAPILLLIAPVALAMAILLAPPLLITAMAFRDFAESSVEIIRYRPVTAAEMPAAAQQWLEQNAPEFQAVGFRLIGDFRLKERSVHFARVFINADGDVLGEIAWAKALPWLTKRCCSFYSVTNDLTYLETGNLALPRQTYESPFILQAVPNATVAETLRAHCERLRQLAEERQTTPLCFAAEDFEKVGLYGQKLCYARLKSRGVISRNPYDDLTLDFPARDAGDATTAQRGGMPLVDPIGDWRLPNAVG